MYMASAERSMDSFSSTTSTLISTTPITTSTKSSYFGHSTSPLTPDTITPNGINIPSTQLQLQQEYTSLYPPSPPSSLGSDTSSTKSYSNPLYSQFNSPSTPIKPLLTPRSSLEDTLTFPRYNLVKSVFPHGSPIHSLPTTLISLDSIVPSWSGAVVENSAMGTRTLLVSGGSFEDFNLRESVCAVLEKAEEELGCTGVVMCLKKNTPDLGKCF